MRILFVGDVVGQPGRRILARELPRLRRDLAPALVVVNGENGAAGAGLTPQTAREIFRSGADVITSGNHIWDRREILPFFGTEPLLLRPANYPAPAPGSGCATVTASDGTPVAVINLIGRVFMAPVDDPFRAADELLRHLEEGPRVRIVDFHAEATSEKIALGWYLDGRVSAVLGTHTHVPTADETVLPGGTAYVTDVGMTGPYDSVIGVDKREALERFLTQRPTRFRTAAGDVRLAGAVVEVCPETGRASSIERVLVSEQAEEHRS